MKKKVALVNDLLNSEDENTVLKAFQLTYYIFKDHAENPEVVLLKSRQFEIQNNIPAAVQLVHKASINSPKSLQLQQKRLALLDRIGADRLTYYYAEKALEYYPNDAQLLFYYAKSTTYLTVLDQEDESETANYAIKKALKQPNLTEIQKQLLMVYKSAIGGSETKLDASEKSKIEQIEMRWLNLIIMPQPTQKSEVPNDYFAKFVANTGFSEGIDDLTSWNFRILEALINNKLLEVNRGELNSRKQSIQELIKQLQP